MTTLDGIPLFKGEAMLLSWGDTSSRGKTVTFALHEDDCGTSHPFRDLGTGRHGQRFQIVAVPITDEGEPIPPGATTGAAIGSAAADHPPPPERSAIAPGGAKRKFSELPLPQQVALRCQDERFQDWASRHPDFKHVAFGPTATDQTAAWVRHRCGNQSRALILPGTVAAQQWGEIETGYLQFTGQVAEERR